MEKRPPCTDDKVTPNGHEEEEWGGVGSGLNLDKPSHEFRNYTRQLCMCVYTYIHVFCRIKKRKKGGENESVTSKHCVLMRSNEFYAVLRVLNAKDKN